MNVVLVEPEIPPNTGNIARLCAATNSRLHLIEPLGFSMDDRQMKRAGMDYWKLVDWRRWKNWRDFLDGEQPQGRLWLVESNGPTRYCDARFGADDYLVFGRETKGLPPSLLEEYGDSWLNIPMANASARSLNLGSCVAIVLFEALRQLGFPREP